ncbi:hypothetical protein [Mycobacterium sp. M23085]
MPFPVITKYATKACAAATRRFTVDTLAADPLEDQRHINQAQV